MNSARKQLVIGAEPPTVSPHSSRLQLAGASLASASLGDPILEKVRESKLEAEQEPVRNGLPATKKLSEVVRTFCRTPERERRIDLLAVMRLEARGLREAFAAANFEALAIFTSALERLFMALSKDVGGVNGSTLKTVSHAMDFLTRAASSSSGHAEMADTPVRMLAVDDDPVCLRTLMTLASKNNGVRLIACDRAEPALLQLKTGDFDLIFSDILMPGMNGFEFLAELRKLPNHRTTPVVFVSGLSDFETRSRSALSGGCDLIGKPFTASEVLVKVLTLGLKRRFDSAAAVAQVERKPQETKPNGSLQDSELPSPNNGGNGDETSQPASFTLKGLSARGVIVVEEHGGIRSINMAAAELLGYSPDEAANGDIRALIPDELQSEENKTLLSQALAGTVKSKSGIGMIGRRKDNSTVQLLVSVGEAWVGRQRSIMCLLQPASPPVAAKEEASPPAFVAKSAPAESTSPIEHRNTTLAELARAKEYWEVCASERAALLEELKNRMRGQDSAIEDLRRESETSKELLERQAQEHLERQSELKELVRAKEYWEGCAAERAALLEEQKSRLRGQDCSVEDLRRESEALKAFCKARVGELQQTRTLLERQAKEHLERQSELQCKCVTLQEQLDTLTQSLTKASAGRTAAEHEVEELAASRKREEDLRTDLKAAEAALAALEKNRTAQGQESDRTQEKAVEMASRVGELESALQAEVVERGNWERRAAEQEQARVALEGKIQEWTEREGQLKLECARLEKQGRELTEALSQTQALLAQEAAGRTAAEQQAGELAASREREENLRAELKAAEAVVTSLEKNRTALGQELGQAQAKVAELASRVGELESTLREEERQRGNLEKQAADLEQARVALEGESGQQEQNLRVELKAAEVVVADLEKNRTTLGQDLGLAQAKVGELASRVGELENTLREEVRQRGNWEQRAAELEQARVALEGESGQQKQNLRTELKAAKAALAGLEKHRTTLGQELGQAQAKVAELASRVGELESTLREEERQRGNLEKQAADLEQAWVALEGESGQQNQKLQAELKAAEAVVADLEKNRTALGQELGLAQAKVGELASRVGELESTLREEVRQRGNWEQRAIELEQARLALEGESGNQKKNLRAELKAAKVALTGLEKDRTALGQELSQAQAKAAELASRVGELESQLRAEIGQRGNWEQRAAELEQTRVALQGEIREWAEREGQLKSECARLEQQGRGLTDSLLQTQALLANEAAGRTAAQHKTDELAELRRALELELATSREREEDLRAGLKAAKAAVTGLEKNRTLLGQELGQAKEKVGELASRVGELESQLQAEIGQRGNWELRAAELEQARVALQGEIREWAEREGQLKSEHARLEQQSQGLTESLSQTQALLAKESAGRTAAQHKTDELAEQRRALEQELAASRERESKLRAGLKATEVAVTGMKKNRTALGRELDQAQEKIGELASRVGELESQLQAEVSQRENWERRATELEQARMALQGEIREWATREDQLKSECVRLEQQGKELTESLSQTQGLLTKEAAGRTAAQQQVGELTGLRSALEQELVRRKETEEKLQSRLKEKRARLETSDNSLAAQQSHLEAKTRELQAAQAAMAERAQQERQLRGECARLEQELQAVAESLGQTRAQFAAEAEQRTGAESRAGELAEVRSALEQELARRKQAEEKLQGALQEKQAQLQTTKEDLSAQTSHLEARTRALQAAQAALAEQAQQERQLKGECARLEQELQAVAESLAKTRAQFAAEAEHRTAAESRAGELAEVRSALEQELARHKQTEEKLQSALREKQAQLQTTNDNLSAHQSHLEARTQELQAAQAALTERTQQERQLKGECARLEQELRAVAESLAQTRVQFAAEAERRAAAESQAGELAELRSALEQELARRKEAEEKLQGALQEKQAQLQTTKEDLSAQTSHLEARTRDLQAAQAALAEQAQQELQLKGECARLEQELRSVAQLLAQTRVQFAAEAEHRTAAESQAGELAELRSALEQELARRKEAEEKLQGALQEKQAQLQTTKEDLSAQTSHLEARTRDLQAAQAALAEQAQQELQLKGECARLEQELRSVAQLLAQTRVQFAAEAEHRTAAESQAGELAELRSALEQELARRKETEEKLQSELREKRAQLQTTNDSLSVQTSYLEARTRELQASQAEVTERTQQEHQLTGECARLEQELRAVAESLAQTRVQFAAEAEHRTAAESRAGELAELRSALEQELARRKQAEEKLQGALQEKQAQLQTTKEDLSAQTSHLEARTRELQASQAEVAEQAQQERQLKGECARLEQELRAMTESLAQTRGELAAETGHRTVAELRVGDLAALRSALEQELARRKETEEKLQSKLQEKQAQLQTTNDSLSAQQRHLEAKTRELQAAEAALAERTQQERQLRGECARLEQELRAVTESLAQTGAQLAAETERGTAAESRAGELAEVRRALEQEIARRKQTEETLQSDLQEKQARLQATNDSLSAQQSHLEAKTRELQAAHATLHELTAANEAVAQELSAARGQQRQEEMQRRRLAGMILEEQDAKAELSKQLQAVCERERAQQQAIAELEVGAQRNLKALKTLESSLETESAQRRRLQSQLEGVEARLREASRQLELKNAAEQSWRQREAELEAGVHRLQEQVISSAANITIREEELRSTTARLEESLLIQSALCGKVNDLAARECSLAQCQTETNQQLALAQRKIEEGQKDLAALRYAVLDAQRLRLQIDHKRLQGTRQRLDGLQEVTSVLLNTPLSMAQRGVANSLKAALAGWIGDCGHSASSEAFPVETPGFQSSEFSLGQVTESAFRQIAESAAQSNVKASTITSGEVPDKLYGDGAHIHQLITLLADSLLRYPDARSLAVRVQVNQVPPAAAELNLLFAIESDADLKEASKSLARAIAGSHTLDAAQLGEVESGLAACWNLALAMGGSLQCDAPGDKQVNFKLVVPVGLV